MEQRLIVHMALDERAAVGLLPLDGLSRLHGVEIEFRPNAKPSYERKENEPIDRTRVYNTLNYSTSPECW